MHVTLNGDLRRAVVVGRKDEVERALSFGADINSVHGAFGWTSLMYAAWNGETEIAEILLNYNADANVRDRYGRTALHKAAYYGHDIIVYLLLKNNADYTLKGRSGKTALDLAKEQGHIGVIELLESVMSSPTNTAISAVPR